MNTRLSRNKSIELHREMWEHMSKYLKNIRSELKPDLSNIYDIYTKCGYTLSELKLKVLSDPEMIKKSGFDPRTTDIPTWKLQNLCFLCEYTDPARNGCSHCPVVWGYDFDTGCCSPGSIYNRFNAVLKMFQERLMMACDIEEMKGKMTYDDFIKPLDVIIEYSSAIAQVPEKVL